MILIFLIQDPKLEAQLYALQLSTETVPLTMDQQWTSAPSTRPSSQLTQDFTQAQLFLASLPTPFTTAEIAPFPPLSSPVMTTCCPHQLITPILQPTAQQTLQPITACPCRPVLHHLSPVTNLMQSLSLEEGNVFGSPPSIWSWETPTTPTGRPTM